MSKAIKHYGIVNKVWLKRYKKKRAESNTEQREREKKSKDESG